MSPQHPRLLLPPHLPSTRGTDTARSPPRKRRRSRHLHPRHPRHRHPTSPPHLRHLRRPLPKTSTLPSITGRRQRSRTTRRERSDRLDNKYYQTECDLKPTFTPGEPGRLLRQLPLPVRLPRRVVHVRERVGAEAQPKERGEGRNRSGGGGAAVLRRRRAQAQDAKKQVQEVEQTMMRSTSSYRSECSYRMQIK